ncbi:MAG: pilus assembly protein [Chloroflexi bacterium]|nr:pilus assembly protein [Chloroflexota bacterium]
MGDRGQSLIETALSLSILVFLLIGGSDFARVYATQVAVLNAARAGVEAGSIKTAANDAAIITYVSDELSRVPGYRAADATITVAHSVGGGGENLTTVRVQYVYRTLIAWPLVPKTVNLDRSAVMRQYP